MSSSPSLGRPPPRLAPARPSELGLSGHLLTRLIARLAGVRSAGLFTTLARERSVFRGWLHFSSALLMRSALSRRDTELVILRVGCLRSCAYELDHHERLAQRAGLDGMDQARIYVGPNDPAWSSRDRAILAAVDQLVVTRQLHDEQWTALAECCSQRECLSVVMLACQYDMLATMIAALGIPRDEPSSPPR